MFKTFEYFSNKCWFHIMLIRITNREDHDQTASSANTFKQLSYSAHQFIIMLFPNEYQDDYFFYFLTETFNWFSRQLSLNADQEYCRMLQGEHSAILWTFIKLPFAYALFCLFLSGRLRQVLLYSRENF